MARILLVDDDADIRAMLQTLLERQGHDVLPAGNGEEAMAIFERVAVDLIVTDIFMPEKCGLETIIAAYRAQPDPRIIAITGGPGEGADIDLSQWAARLGARRTMRKPFGHVEFLRAVDEVLAA